MSQFIAIPSNDGITVEEHFGHCKKFVMVTVEEGKVQAKTEIIPPAHAPGVFPAFLGEQGATTIITGGMGARAVDLFKQQGIDVILGATGSIDDLLAVFLEGELASTGSVCSHQH
ncbi:MAG: NifB/NifX family molybdenum-iron cluster-binding protein [Spirochaetales bacterium]|nr:NifB/NifX family molybdenum-iron cluster-binding protein [Spirochaetales bacterium]